MHKLFKFFLQIYSNSFISFFYSLQLIFRTKLEFFFATKLVYENWVFKEILRFETVEKFEIAKSFCQCMIIFICRKKYFQIKLWKFLFFRGLSFQRKLLLLTETSMLEILTKSRWKMIVCINIPNSQIKGWIAKKVFFWMLLLCIKAQSF